MSNTTDNHAKAASATATPNTGITATPLQSVTVPPQHPRRAPLLTSVQNLPVLKGIETFPKFKRNAEGLMVSHKRYYIVKEVNVPQTSTSVRRGIRRDQTTVTTTNTTTHPYREEDREDIWAFLIRCLDDSIISHFTLDVLDPINADAEGLWREIHEKFDRTDIQSAGRYLGKLWSVKLKEDGNAQRHINRFQNYFNKLTVAGDAPSDKNFAIALLQSLPGQYTTLQATKFADPFITSQNVKSAIMSDWERLGRPGGDAVEDSDDEEAGNSKGVKALISKTLEAKSKDRSTTNPKKYCTEHPNANSHDTKDCKTLQYRRMEEKDKKIDELTKQLNDLKSASSARANVAQVKLGQENGDGSGGWIAVAPTALVGTHMHETKYVIDSAATEHMVCTKEHLSNIVPINESIKTGGNNFVLATHKGTLDVAGFELKDVLYAPTLGYNLISVIKLGALGYKFAFEGNRCVVTDRAGKTVLDITGDGLYTFKSRAP